MGTIQTVCGAIPSTACGMTLAHEHLFIDMTNEAAASAEIRPVESGDFSRLLRDPYCMRDNLLLTDESDALEECRDIASIGCKTVVDCSTAQIGRNPAALKRLSELSGIQIVMGSGFYTGDTFPAETAMIPAERLAEEIVDECLNGVGKTGIRPGVLGEFGTSRKVLPNEWRALEAAAIAHSRTGLSIQAHIYPWCTNGLDVAKFLMERNVSPERIVVCHSDVALDATYIRALLALGVFVEFDNFGKEFTPTPGASFAGGNFAKDTERVALLAELYRDGYARQLLATNDICLKCMLRKFGGRGYAHVIRDIPPMLEKYGIPSKEWFAQVMCDNPMRLLSV